VTQKLGWRRVIRFVGIIRICECERREERRWEAQADRIQRCKTNAWVSK
jgi:hypothetical protein